MDKPKLGIPSPNQWLCHIVRKQNIPGSRIARLIGGTAPQFARWISGTETIPLEHLLCISKYLTPDEENYVCLLKNIENLQKTVHKSCLRLQKVLGVSLDFFAMINKTLKTCLSQTEHTHVSLASTYLHALVDARFTLHLFENAIESSFSSPLLPKEAGRMLRHPINHLLGLFLSPMAFLPKGSKDRTIMQELREIALHHLYKISLKSLGRGEPLDITGQFSSYFLARYGSLEHQGRLQELLLKKQSIQDLLVRRFIYSGLLQSQGSPSEETYLDALQRDRAFGLLNLQFDSFHYGDISLEEDGKIPTGSRQYQKTVDHMIRHLKHPHLYPHIQEVEAFKLLQVFDFVRPSTVLPTQSIAQMLDLPKLTEAPLSSFQGKLRIKLIEIQKER